MNHPDRRAARDAESPLAVVERSRDARPRFDLEGVLPPLRHRALREVPQAVVGVDYAEEALPGAGRSLDVACVNCLRATPTRKDCWRGSAVTVGASAADAVAHSCSRLTGFRNTLARVRNPGQLTETPWSLSWKAEGKSLRSREALPCAEESGIDETDSRSLGWLRARHWPRLFKGKLRTAPFASLHY